MESIHLIGAEDVSRAGYTMRDAAREMRDAANIISGALEDQRRFMEDWLTRFEQAMQPPVINSDPKNDLTAVCAVCRRTRLAGAGKPCQEAGCPFA